MNGPWEDRLPASGWSAASTAPRRKRRHGRYRSYFSRRYGAAPAVPRADPDTPTTAWLS